MRHALWLLLAFSGLGEAQVYRAHDANGIPLFTDRPPLDGALPIATSPLNRMPALHVATAPASPPPATEQRSPYSALRIISPSPDNVSTEGSGTLRIDVASEPTLLPGHRYRLQLDDQTALTRSHASLQLHNVDRGSHRLRVEIIDDEDSVLIASAEQQIHVRRPSLLHPQRVRRCRVPSESRPAAECPPDALKAHHN